MPGRFTVRQISEMIGLTPRQIRSYVSLGILEPTIGPRGRFEFSFQDLVVLRSAKGLLDAEVTAAQVHAALVSLRDEIAADEALTTFSIVSDGKDIVVARGDDRWQPLSGQEVFNLDVDELADTAGRFVPMKGPVAASSADAEAWFVYGDEVEGVDIHEALRAYARAVEIDPEHVDALINLGRLRHRAGELTSAIKQYRAALDLQPSNSIAWFNLGVALEGLGDLEGAIDAYERSLAGSDELPDAHRNLGELLEQQGRSREALQHLHAFRRLST